MKKLLLTLGLLLLGGGAANAQDVYDKGYSTFTAAGVFCTTGTSVQLNISTRAVPGFNIGGYRIINLDSADAVYIGQSASVSTTSTRAIDLAVLGERISAAGSSTFAVGRHPDTAAPVGIWCMAADAAGAASALLNIVSFGYR